MVRIPFALSLLAPFACVVAAGVGRQDLVSRQTTTTTGDHGCSTYMCINATQSGSTVQYALTSTGKASPGWMAIGFGSQMTGSPMVIIWPNSDGTFTLSQRQASGEIPPSFVSNPPRTATLLSNISTTSGNSQYAFSIPSDGSTNVNLIWAFGTESANPGSKSADASFTQQHLDSGTAQFDLSKPLSGSSGNSSDGGSGGGLSSSSDGPLTYSQRLAIAHAIFCVVGFLLFLPAGALLARYVRTFSPVWFKGHWIFQFAISGPIIIIGVSLGIASVSNAGAAHLDDSHKKWGIAIFVLYIFQCALGGAIHFVKPKSFNGRPPLNYVHAIIGLLLLGLGLYQVRTGYRTEWPTQTGRGKLMQGADIVWYVWVALIPVLYFAGLALLPKQLAQEKASPKRSISDDSVDEVARYRD